MGGRGEDITGGGAVALRQEPAGTAAQLPPRLAPVTSWCLCPSSLVGLQGPAVP